MRIKRRQPFFGDFPTKYSGCLAAANSGAPFSVIPGYSGSILSNLRAARRAARQIGFEVYVSSPANTPARILCVDDRISSLEVRRALLTTIGYDVLIASDPPSALAITNKVEVDLIILDYNFPGEMTGEELAHKLRAANPQLPLIMLSGVPELPQSAAASVDLLLTKGAGRPTDLLQAIARLLEGKSSAPKVGDAP